MSDFEQIWIKDWNVMKIVVAKSIYKTMPWYIKLRFKLTQLVVTPLMIRLVVEGD